MSAMCPVCGRQIYNFMKCICGYYTDEWNIMKAKEIMTKKEVSLSIPERQNGSEDAPDEDNMIVKEIDSWVFTYSPEDNTLSLGTPALQSFRLQLTLSDLEDLTEFMYQRTGQGKTLRKLNLTTEELPEVLASLSSIIDEKRKRIPLNFDDDELQSMVDLINHQLTK